jgi:hypothetical protein
MLNLERGSRLTTLIVVLAGMIIAPHAFADDADAFVGTWRLVEHSNWDSSGTLVQNFGPNPIGYFVHDRTGHFSVQIMRTPAFRTSAEEPDSMTESELRELFQGYYASFGTYTVDSISSESVYQIEGSTRPHLIGIEVGLPYRIEGDSLIIGDGKTWHRLWQRVR